MFGTILSSAVSFGLAVHFRMYPIIYAVPFIVVLDVHYHVNWNYYGRRWSKVESRYAWSRSTEEKTSSEEEEVMVKSSMSNNLKKTISIVNR